MAQLLTPVSDQATGIWTNAPLWSKANSDDGTDAISDAVGNNTNTSVAVLGLASGTDPNSSSEHIMRVRWHHDQSGRSMQATADLYQGDPGAGGSFIARVQSATDVGTTEVEDTRVLSAFEADSITDYSDLYVRLFGAGTGGGPGRSLHVDLVELSIPDGGASPITVELVAATATATPQALNLSLGAVSTELVAATADLIAQELGVSLEAATIELTPATVTLTPQSLGVSLGALSIPLSPATVSLAAQALDVDIAGVPVEVELTPATVSLVTQALGVTTDPLSVALAPATATLTPQALEISLEAKTVELSPATVSLVAQALGVEVSGAPVSVALVPATLTASAQALGVSLMPLDVELTPATLSTAAQILGVSVEALDIELVAAEITLVAQALGVDIVGGEDPFEALRAAQINMLGPW